MFVTTYWLVIPHFPNGFMPRKYWKKEATKNYVMKVLKFDFFTRQYFFHILTRTTLSKRKAYLKH